MVDGVVGAELAGFLQFFVGACGSDHAGAKELGDLDRRAADAAARAEDENVFRGLQFRAGNEHVPRRLEDQRHRSSFLKREIFRIGQAIYFRDTDEFRAATVDHVAEVGELAAAVVQAGDAGCALAASDAGSDNYFLADANGGNFRADLRDFAGDVAAGNVRERNWNARQALADPDVEMVQSAGADADKHFAGANGWIGCVGVLENAGSAVLVKDDGFHSGNGISPVRV